MTVAVVGLGGAGGNVANEAAKLHISAGAINFSQKDLDSLEDVRYKLKIMGSEGVGHDRALAIELVQEHYAMIVKFVKDTFSNPSIDIIFLPFASGGGSGSGIAPMLSELLAYEMPDKVIVPMPILADDSEMLMSQSNTYNAMEELSRLDLCILPIDNNEVRNIYKTYKNKVYEIANSTAALLISKIVAYTDKSSKNGNFDNRDLITVFRQRGMAIIAEAEIASLPKAEISTKGVAESVVQSWESSIFAPIEYMQVAKCAFIFDGQEFLIEHINYKEIFSKFVHGVPLDLFEGYYDEHNGKVITILTGLPWCGTRMEYIYRLIEEGKEKAELVINIMENEQFSSKMVDFSQKLRQNAPKREKSANINELLNKYRR